MLNLTLKLDVSKIVVDAKAMAQSISNGALVPGLKVAAARYLGFIRRRFLGASMGDGTWPDLALSTKIKRLRARKKSAGKLRSTLRTLDQHVRVSGAVRLDTAVQIMAAEGTSFAILRDTSTLFNSLTLGNADSIEIAEPTSITVGTAVKYAKHHQSPTRPRRPPQRLIFVDPDERTKDLMRLDVQWALDKAAAINKAKGAG